MSQALCPGLIWLNFKQRTRLAQQPSHYAQLCEAQACYYITQHIFNEWGGVCTPHPILKGLNTPGFDGRDFCLYPMSMFVFACRLLTYTYYTNKGKIS